VDRDRGHSAPAWAAMLAAATLLALLLVAAVRLLYPRGPVASPPPPRPEMMIVLLPPATVVPDTTAVPAPEAPSPPPGPVSPGFLRHLLLAQPTAPPVTAPPSPGPPPLLALQPPAGAFLAAPPDTTRSAALWRMAWLRRSLADSLMWEGLLGYHARRWAAFLADKKTIFGEDWLSAQPLASPPSRR